MYMYITCYKDRVLYRTPVTMYMYMLHFPFSPQLVTRLQADEALIKSLTDQVNELTSSDSLSRVRESYSSAMAHSAHQHQQEVLQLQEQLEHLREEMERKVNVTCNTSVVHAAIEAI